MLALLAVNGEGVAVRRVLAMVAAGRGDEHHHDAAFGNRLTVVVDVAFIAMGSRSHIRVEPSRSVRRKVTVPDGGCAVIVLGPRQWDGAVARRRCWPVRMTRLRPSSVPRLRYAGAAGAPH